MLDLTKPMQTRNGFPARFLEVLGGRTRGHAFVVTTCGDLDTIYLRDSDGRSNEDCSSDWDIINVPPKPVTIELTQEQATFLRQLLQWDYTVPRALKSAGKLDHTDDCSYQMGKLHYIIHKALDNA